MSQSSKPSLVGSILERKGGTSSPPSVRTTGKTGFPVVQHRSKSAFSRAREEGKKGEGSSRLPQPPSVRPSAVNLDARSSVDGVEDEPSKAEVIAQASNDWRRQMEEDNQRRVETMSAEELEEARKSILEQFGPDIGEILRQSRLSRQVAPMNLEDPLHSSGRANKPRADSKVLKSAIASRAASPDPLSPRPSSRLDRQIRFADLTPKDVYVYESAPPSPPKKALALPAPSEADGPTIALGRYKGSILPAAPEDITMSSPTTPEGTQQPTNTTLDGTTEPEEGTPEYIRRHFFPNLPKNDPALAWIDRPDNPESSETSQLRFDFSGTPIPHNLSKTLPTHLGLHHHAEGTHAGYSLDDIFMLVRSTVPAQRASMLKLLGTIALRLGKGEVADLQGQERALRKKIIENTVEAMHERGSVGVRAVEVLWSCIVAWEADSATVPGIERKDPSSDVFDTLPLEYVLKHISDDFEVAAFPPETLSQQLAIVHRLAQESNAMASAIIEFPKLVPNMLRRFVLIQDSSEVQPDPLAIEVLVVLAQASRKNASVVADSAPALLRFVVILPASSLYPSPLATSLLSSTLHLYSTLASYGFCSQLATTASEPLNKLTHFVVSDACTSNPLRLAWLQLIESWVICAIDPHRTTPDHDILWSQVVGWEWGPDILLLRSKLDPGDHTTWSALWRTEAAWLEGCSVNSPKGGETEKAYTVSQIRDGFEKQTERQLVATATRDLAQMLSSISPTDTSRPETWQKLAQWANLVSSSIRLWLACLPTQLSGPPSSPPFLLPFAEISAACAQLTTHPLWTITQSTSLPPSAHVHMRSLSTLLSSYLGLSRASPGVPPPLWLAQASAVICRLLPGDEEHAASTVSFMSRMITPDVIQMLGWTPAPILHEMKLDSVLPLLVYSFEQAPKRISPIWVSPTSISRSDTLRLPFAPSKPNESSLPLPKDWIFSPLDHLLRSGQTDVFRSLPSSWDYSEIEVTRATLLLAKIHRHALMAYQLDTFALTREETVFNCMKVFMLEHEQQQETSIQEVFRDATVNRLLEDVLEPFTIAAAMSRPTNSSVTQAPSSSLEDVSQRFLGAGTPFYQYYTDFVALYDSISFSHPLFSRLLLPAISMRYPADFRKYLWADYSQVLRTVRVPIESVIAAGLHEYMWPLETNPEVLAAYLRALVKGNTDGILRLIATHHIACNIWPDLRGNIDGDERSVKLLQAVVGQAGFDTIKDVASYYQTLQDPLLPPACFTGLQKEKESRRLFAEKCGVGVRDRLQVLFT
ncbi:hypothetical protein BDW22DRAFT_1353080 [Trametopsis cervina]|nr:hypothetical protein BDW22DRAFT_1353080 [Trametopsis cervina]